MARWQYQIRTFVPRASGLVSLDWYAIYPDQIYRAPLPVSARTTVVWDGLPRPAVDLLSVWAIYPDWITHQRLATAAQLAFSMGDLVPIVTPTTIIEDRILLGQNQSVETPAYPSIGGSTTWS